MRDVDRRILLWLSFLVSLTSSPFLFAVFFHEGGWPYLMASVWGAINAVWCSYQLRSSK